MAGGDQQLSENLENALSQLTEFANEKMYAYKLKKGAGENQFGVKMGHLLLRRSG